jgi:bacillithiol biosynthesis cysteine-adding enzyme BshC
VGDYLQAYGKVEEFYDGDFRRPESFRRQAERVNSRRLPREKLAEVLREQNKSYGCGAQTLAQIDRIVREEAAAVVTGQQVGLFSGPLYTIYKALTAVKLSAYLNAGGPGSFVPVFWLASDDHDLAEIDHITILSKDNRLEAIRCLMPSAGARMPASNLILPPAIEDCHRQLRDSTLDSEFKPEVMEHLREAYGPGRSFAEAFARWLTRLFGAAGLILIDASHPRLKEMGKDVFIREIEGRSPSTERAIAASRALLQAGYAAQVPLHEGILNVFYAGRERQTIQWEGEAFAVKGAGRVFPKEELLSQAAEKPSSFSPNVLLRPIYQDCLLPTVAYVGGPGEIAYFAQMKGVYESYGLPMPVIYPRKSVTLVERKVDRILKKYGLTIPDLWSRGSRVIAGIKKKQIPDSLNRAMRLVLEHLEQDFEGLKPEVTAFEPTLRDSLDLARGKMNRQLKFLEEKILKAAASRNETALRQVHTAGLSLYPGRHLQERVFNIVPYLIKYGYGLMDRLNRDIQIDEHNHQVLLI